MKHRFFYVVMFALVCMLALLGIAPKNAQADTLDPFIFGIPISLDPCQADASGNCSTTGLAHEAAVLALDPTDATALLKTYARCSWPGGPQLYGITVGLMYCIQSYISNATHIYSTGLSNSSVIPIFNQPLNFFVVAYQSSCYLLAIALFGVRLMTFQSENVLTESMTLLVRFAISIYLVTQAPNLYDAATGAIGEGIGWMTNVVGATAFPTTCGLIGPLQQVLTTVDPSVDYTQYQVWHLVDCLFMHLFGAGFPTLNINSTVLGINQTFSIPGSENVVYSSSLPVIAAAFVSSVFGFTVGLMGLGALITFFELILKCMLLVLTSYLTLSMLTLLCPFVAPLLVFESHNKQSMIHKIFQGWIGTVIAAVVQPIILIAYLSFAISLIDMFIEGDSSTDPIISGLFANCSRPDQMGDELCSFDQLYSAFPKLGATIGGTVPIPSGNYNMFMDLNPVIAHIRVIGNPQASASNCALMDRNRVYLQQTINDLANQVESKASGPVITGPARLKTDPIRLSRLELTLIVIIVLGYVLYQLMETIPELVETLGGSALKTGWKGMKVPFVDGARAAVAGAEKGLKSWQGNTGLLGAPGAAKKMVEGGVNNWWNSMTGKR